MPSDRTDTKAHLAEEAERLFAERGIWQVPSREIIEAAGQRNASAISYHFGSREGVLDYLLHQHGDPIDAERGALLADIGEDGSTSAIVAALVRPMVDCLATVSGRRYLRIVAQVMAAVGSWRNEGVEGWPNLTLALSALEHRPPDVEPSVRIERVNAMVLLMTASLADRARNLDSGPPAPSGTALSATAYEENLTNMLVGVLSC